MCEPDNQESLQKFASGALTRQQNKSANEQLLEGLPDKFRLNKKAISESDKDKLKRDPVDFKQDTKLTGQPQEQLKENLTKYREDKNLDSKSESEISEEFNLSQPDDDDYNGHFRDSFRKLSLGAEGTVFNPPNESVSEKSTTEQWKQKFKESEDRYKKTIVRRCSNRVSKRRVSKRGRYL